MVETVEARRTYSLSEAAKILEVSRNTLMRWLDDGCPSIERGDKAAGKEWRLSIRNIVEWREEVASLEERKRWEHADTSELTAEEADRRRKVALMVQEEAKADEVLGSLVRVADVEQDYAERCASMRSKLEQIGAQVAGRAAALTDTREIQTLVDRRIREAVDEFVRRREKQTAD
jgi:phage terminase Nu1 subunit (DNA packaging protein)